MVTINKGAVKFKSIKAAYEAAKKKEPKLSYMTFYMRMRNGKSVSQAFHAKVRRYEHKNYDLTVEGIAA